MALDGLVGRTGIVTGAGSGIGRAVTLELAGRGADVLAVDLDLGAAEATAAQAPRKGGRIAAHQADVSDVEQVRGYVEAATVTLGPPTLFHNNAGIGGAHVRIIDLDPVEWERAMRINLTSVFLGLKYILPKMVEAGGGAIVNTGSLLTIRGAPRRADYAVTKHGVLGLTRTAAAEHARDNIRVNAVGPGPIETPLQHLSERLMNPANPEQERERFTSVAPMGRYGTVEEIAHLVMFLLSPQSSYVTGALFMSDGGLSAV